ncbi:MAG: tRNA (adenosine(37)-N6)-threonylcarbamoyltransferase complex dimerization subunit type 1 TsaB [Desulfobacteraceae bacterium]|nr:MAG: tRNA (adenosine(37)-N6)-threonylcarbamoyltransferase complex dimerization subunit type 1 TsaB [Desulfobacteraceae bacterium]
MRILAVDTATEVCGVALWEDDHITAEIRMSQGKTHTQTIMTAIEAVLEKGRLAPNSLDAFVVTQGPGSFTGLRIGISTVKGLAAATGKPLVGISTLAVLAHQAPDGTPWVCPMIDARRREVYWSIYRRQDNALVQAAPERAGKMADVRLGGEGGCLFIGSGARLYAQALQERWPQAAHLADDKQHDLRPGVLASLGAQRLGQGFTEDLHRFTPVYLRPSDAELGAAQEGRSQ